MKYAKEILFNNLLAQKKDKNCMLVYPRGNYWFQTCNNVIKFPNLMTMKNINIGSNKNCIRSIFSVSLKHMLHQHSYQISIIISLFNLGSKYKIILYHKNLQNLLTFDLINIKLAH